jgi:hypothetical protein
VTASRNSIGSSMNTPSPRVSHWFLHVQGKARQRSWSWTTGKGGPNRPPLTLTCCCGVGREFQVPWGPHHQQTIMSQTHQDSHEEDTTKPFPLRRLKIFGMGPQILKRFYRCTIESILTGCITAWYGNYSASDRKALQRVVRMAQYITGAKVTAIQDLYNRRCQRKAHKIVRDSSHPSHRLFSLLPHGKRYRSAKSTT